MKNILSFILAVLTFSSCVNYIPCRGQNYLVEGVTNRELIERFNKLRELYPEYKSDTPDWEAPSTPHYYIELNWADLDVRLSCDIHTGIQEPGSPASLKFTLIRDRQGYKDINSRELDRQLNEFYKEKFENEVLGKMDLNWRRKSCR